MQNKGGNYKTFNRRVEIEKIDISHFNIQKVNIAKRIDDDLIFRENSMITRHTVRKRVINDNLIPYECRKCKNDGTWNGAELSLHLEHINGKSNDHRLENLCFLCPNCHSQTDTYSGRNARKSEVPKCLKCAKKISIGTVNQLCQLCFIRKNADMVAFKRRRAVRPDKETLLKEIQEMGYVKTGKKYGVSDNAIRKWLKGYEKHENKEIIT